MRPWLRNGLIFGAAAGVATILVNVLGSLNRPANICTTGPGNLPLTLTGLLLYLLIAGAAGWQTTRAGSRVRAGALAGLVTGAVSGIPVLVGILLSLDLAVQAAHCPHAAAGTPPSDDVIRAIGVILALVIVAIGMGVGAAAVAAGGAIGERRDTA